MQYTNTITIHKPIDEVVRKFTDEDALKHWQPGLQKMEHISGEKGKAGSVYRLYFQLGKREVIMTETILTMNLPEKFEATYEAKGVWNKEQASFEKVGDDTTIYHGNSKFKFSGFMKIVGWIFPGAFKKQSLKYLENFKAFVEEGKSVLEEAKS